MANQIALRLHTEPGDELLGEENCHVFLSELGGPAVHSGRRHARPAGRRRPLQRRAGARGLPRPGDPLAAHAGRSGSRTRTTRAAAGSGPSRRSASCTRVALELDLGFHLDGARLMNAAVATGIDAAEIGGRFDTVTLCLSKGLGCPLGAILAGQSEVMGNARRLKHLFGGAMRQAGIVAAAGVYALDHHVDRLADDHAPREAARARPRRGRPRGRSRADRDELRPARRRAADEGGGDRAPRRAGRRALGDDPPDRAPRRHAPRHHGRGHRRRVGGDSSSARSPCPRLRLCAQS